MTTDASSSARPWTFSFAAGTDPGWKYAMNQDAVLVQGRVWQTCDIESGSIDTTDLLAAVADGAAFAPCAARASRTVLELLAAQVNSVDRLGASTARRIQRQVTDKAAGTKCEGMSSTLAAAQFSQDGIRIVSVGDSRVYRWRAGELLQISVDHTVARRMVLQGDMTEVEATRAGSLYRDLDSALIASEFEEEFDVFSSSENLRDGDRWLLCSDGVTHALTDTEICALISSASFEPESVVQAILSAAKAQRDSDDNLSVALISVST